jgi:hypothetical protein
MLIDNEKFKNKLGKGQGGYDLINESIAKEILNSIDYLTLLGKPKRNGLGTFDFSEFVRVLEPQEPEGGIYNVYTYNSSSDELVSNLADLPLTDAKRSVVLFHSDKSPSVKLMDSIRSKLGPYVIFKESDRTESRDTTYVITNGIPFPDDIFSERLEIAMSKAKEFKSKNRKDKKKMGKINSNKLLGL